MYTEIAITVIKAVAAYVADEYEKREDRERFARMEARILAAIQAAKAEILAAIQEQKDEELLDAATAIIDVFRTYDRVGGEYTRLQDITSIDGVTVQTELARRMGDFQPVEIEYHKFFVAWLLVTCARAFAHIELTKLGKAHDFDSALEQFLLVRDNTRAALVGLRAINDRRFSGGIFERTEPGKGEGLTAWVGYYFDNEFQDVASYTRIPFDAEGRKRAREKAREKLESHKNSLWDSSVARQTLEKALEEACRHVSCEAPRFTAFRGRSDLTTSAAKGARKRRLNA